MNEVYTLRKGVYYTCMRFTVPQFIEIEDKIFGPLTWKQFLYVGGGFGLAVALFFVNFILFVFVGLPVAALAGALAFYPVNNRPFSVFLESAFNYFMSDHRYFWQNDGSVVYTQKSDRREKDSADYHPPTKGSQPKLASLSRRLELEAIEQEQAVATSEIKKTEQAETESPTNDKT